MKKAVHSLFVAGCLAASTFVSADELLQARSSGPQLLSDAELDAITAGANDTLFLKQVLNPGNAEVLKISNDGTRIHCVNCDGQTNNAETSGVLIIIKTNSIKVKCIGGGTGCT